MTYLCENLCTTILSIVLATALTFYLYLKWKYTYWQRHNFPFLQPRMFFGNLENPFTKTTSAGLELKAFYDQLKSQGAKHGGYYSFSTPVYIPIDLNYIKNVLSKDFQYFTDRGRYYNEKDDPLSAHLFNIEGTQWRNLRTKLTPTFTSGKMKTMFLTLLECGEFFRKAVDSFSTTEEAVEIKDLSNKFTAEVISSCVFGIRCNAFTSSSSEFPKYGQMIVRGSTWEAARVAFTYSFPKLSKLLSLRRYHKRATDFFLKAIEETVAFREANSVARNDFLQILIDLKNQGEGGNLSMEQIAAQAVVFFVAGFDTSAITISFALYELARNQEMQEKVRDEIRKVMDQHGGELTYEGVSEMKYLQQVLDETLRKYPPLPLLNRQSIATYKIPDSDLVLEKGTQIVIPLLGLHRDPEYFPEPDKFDPERFSPEAKSQRKPFSYLPFGDGPRNCIGLRFGLVQVKTGLCMLLRDYKYSVNSKTRVPLEMALSLMCCAKDGIWLDVTKLK